MAAGVGVGADGHCSHTGQPAAEQHRDQQQPHNTNWDRHRHTGRMFSDSDRFSKKMQTKSKQIQPVGQDTIKKAAQTCVCVCVSFLLLKCDFYLI